MSEESQLALRFVVMLALIPAVVVMARRVLRSRRPFHLTDVEHGNYRLVSLGGVGAAMTLMGLSVIPAPIAVVLAAWAAFTAVRVGSRLHIATPLHARFAFGEVEIIDDFNARVGCANDRSWHPTSRKVAHFLASDVVGAAPMSRTLLKQLPDLFDTELAADGLTRAARRPLVSELTDFLRAARECGCLLLEPTPEPIEETD